MDGSVVRRGMVAWVVLGDLGGGGLWCGVAGPGWCVWRVVLVWV